MSITVPNAMLSNESVADKAKTENEPLEPLLEVNESITDKPAYEDEFEEISPRIFSKLTVKEPFMTIESLNNAIYELGVVNLCWPDIEEPVFESRTCFPVSYYTNSPKERLLLAYAENFRRQFNFHYPFKRPLLLQAPNECGLQKMVCTSIRPTKLCFSDTNTWQGVAALVADFFDYEPLTKPMLLPERLMSPVTAVARRRGNPLELAHVAASWLCGAGVDALVCVGCARRDTCLAVRCRTECPDLPERGEPEVAPPPAEEQPRYRLVPLPDFTSQYQADTAAKEAARRQRQLDKAEAERRARVRELEAPPPDPIDGWRTHAWILVLPAAETPAEEPFFIEPSEGLAYPLGSDKYQRIDSVYNHENYYVNLQDCTAGLDGISYDLADLACWEHLLAAEPYRRRQMANVDYSDRSTAVDTDKHLDMPASWVERLDLDPAEYHQRYPGGRKAISYKKVELCKYAPYSEPDGVVKKVKMFSDYALTVASATYEYYKHREDKMYEVKHDYETKFTTEKFYQGRKEHLIKHTYAMDASPLSLEVQRTMEFYYYARSDHLMKLVCSPLAFDEYYKDREDRLESRLIVYSAGTKAEPRRQLLRITETYGRNPATAAKHDVWQRTYLIQEDRIELKYHYAYNFVSNDTREYLKPNLAETGGKILYYPEKTSGYIADPIAEAPRPLHIYTTLCGSMELEERTTKHIRDREVDVASYLRARHLELTEPALLVNTFDTLQNAEAKRGWLEQETQRAEMSEREKEAEIDPLAPYLARMLGAGRGPSAPLAYKEAALVRESCVNDFKARQLARQTLVQERFDQMNSVYKANRLWYLANQFVLSPAKEEEYFQQSAEMAFKVHTLELRLLRHQELSGPRHRALVAFLDRHPLLREYRRAHQKTSLRC